MNFIQKKQKRINGKHKTLQILLEFAGLIWESMLEKQSLLILSSFCGFVEKFQL